MVQKILDMYVNENVGSHKIARELGLSSSYVYNLLKKHNVLRSRDESIKLGAEKRKSYRASDATKKKLSDAMKNAHANGKHPGWTVINPKKNRSYPEKYLLGLLTDNGITEQYTVIEQFPISKYNLDFAIIDLKIDIEIDGQQHFDDASIHRDAERDNYMIESGWRVYRIAWKELQCNDTKQLAITGLLDFIRGVDTACERRYSIDEIKLMYTAKKRTRSEYVHDLHESNKYMHQKRINLVETSGIDLSKYGWVSQVAELLQMKPQKINGWMRTYMADTYTHVCFKRSAKHIIKKHR